MFITIEGIDGAGKTTQAKMLKTKLGEYLQTIKKNRLSGCDVILTKEPNDGSLGNVPNGQEYLDKLSISQIVRKLIATRSNIEPLCQLLLIYAARREHVINLVVPALESNKVVICDRFYDSSVAYFGYNHQGGFLPAKEIVDWLQRNTLQDIMPDKPEQLPDMTFLIDVEPEVSSKRISNREVQDKFDTISHESANKIRNIFLQLAKKEDNGRRYVIIDGNRSIESIHNDIFQKTIEFVQKSSSQNTTNPQSKIQEKLNGHVSNQFATAASASS